MNISSDAVLKNTQPDLEELTPLPVFAKPSRGHHGDAVDGHSGGGAPNTSSREPTDGARQETTGSKPAWLELREEVDARLAADPEYLEAKNKYDTYKNIADDFAIVDAACWFGPNDGKLGYADVKSVAEDPLQTPAAREAARRLLANMSVWNEASKGDQQLTTQDCMEFVAKLKGTLSEMRATMTAEVKAERVAAASGPSQASGATASGPSATAQASTATSIPRPPPSTLPGMEGAMQNLANTGDWLNQQMMDLAQKAAADPSKAMLYQQQIAQLQNQYQAVTNMLNQLTQTTSNLSKMWSDVAMNSIRNLK